MQRLDIDRLPDPRPVTLRSKPARPLLVRPTATPGLAWDLPLGGLVRFRIGFAGCGDRFCESGALAGERVATGRPKISGIACCWCGLSGLRNTTAVAAY
jgi:hypothetical protein